MQNESQILNQASSKVNEGSPSFDLFDSNNKLVSKTVQNSGEKPDLEKSEEGTGSKTDEKDKTTTNTGGKEISSSEDNNTSSNPNSRVSSFMESSQPNSGSTLSRKKKNYKMN